jgi:hypothetical protein
MRTYFGMIAAAALVGCSADDVTTADDDIVGASEDQVLKGVKAAALSRSLKNGWLLAGIAKVETQLTQCKQPGSAIYCAGPASPECGGGPVAAGAADGACKLSRGGIGLFQLDDGTQAQTIANYKKNGMDILTVKGNAEGAIDLLVGKLKQDACLKGINDEAGAMKFLNSLSLGSADYEKYTGMLAHCYNGWRPGQPGWVKQKAKYDEGIRYVLKQFPDAWWSTP